MTNKIIVLAAAACGIGLATSASAMPLNPLRIIDGGIAIGVTTTTKTKASPVSATAFKAIRVTGGGAFHRRL